MSTVPDTPAEPSGVRQVIINVGDSNFGETFTKDHVEFVDRLKNSGKRSATEQQLERGKDNRINHFHLNLIMIESEENKPAQPRAQIYHATPPSDSDQLCVE
ncbi:hypothetical protein CPC16_001826 [Podila verticillata]|nr:hypothetical protein CPC16_001826 [Podila verticillata]KAI9234058.1 MAG: hypothetical protein BYD32DRAFT_464741 [Podila humilis]